MDYIISWDDVKNEILKRERNISFEDIVKYLTQNNLIETIDHPNEKYKHQKMFILNIDNYIYCVPFVQKGKQIFLKTIIPSRKATKQYLRGK